LECSAIEEEEEEEEEEETKKKEEKEKKIRNGKTSYLYALPKLKGVSLKYRHEIQCKISKGKSKKNCLF
jgi:hypothetical protein